MKDLNLEIQKLEKEIRKHDDLYWNQNEPIISDFDYDKLVNRLKELDPFNQLITRLNIEKTSSKNKIKHSNLMLSLEKVYSYQDLLTWCKKISRNINEVFILQPKYDGCSVEYTNNILSTKGDGEYGDDISDKLKVIKIINDNCKSSYIRGELLITKNDFDLLNQYFEKNNLKNYKNSRNAVGGILTQLELPTNFPKVLSLYPFDYLSKEMPLHEIHENTINEYIQFVQNQDFPSDGIVIKIKDNDYSTSLGITSHHSKSQIALKFKNPTGQSKLLDILWSVGKQSVTPIGIIEPVKISGVTIRKVNLHNFRNIIDMDIRLQDILIIERAGDVIPHCVNVMYNINRTNKIDIPKLCPSCQSLLIFKDPNLICNNEDCSGKKHINFLDSIIRIGLDNIGKSTVKKIIDRFEINTILDLLDLKIDDFLQLDGFSHISANKIYQEIQKLKTITIEDWKLLSSINIPGIGKTLSKIILSNVTLKELLDSNEIMFKKYLLDIPNISEKRCIEIYNEINKQREYLMNCLNILKISDSKNQNNNFENIENKKLICLTGKFEFPKDHYKKILEEKGFYVVDNVNENLSYLIVSDLNKVSTKLKRAQKLSIKYLTMDTFMNLFC